MRKIIPVIILLSLVFIRLEAEFLPINQNRSIQSLNGEWDVLPLKSFEVPKSLPSIGWVKEFVPGPSKNITGHHRPQRVETMFDKDGKLIETPKRAACFRRFFEIDPKVFAQNKKVILHFDLVSLKSEAFLNGKKLGTSVQCLVPFEYDVTNIVLPGKNELLMGVYGRGSLIDLETKCYVAPSTGAVPGIRGDVELRFLPKVHIDDVFVKTSVKNKKIEFDLSIKNDTDTDASVRPGILIRTELGKPEIKLEGENVTLAKGEEKVVTIASDWIAPELWELNNPALYWADVRLLQDNLIVDETSTRFGFKEFEIRGRDFYLNGIKITLFRGGTQVTLSATPDKTNIFGDMREKINRPFNCFRLHLGTNNVRKMDFADELGLMIIPESAWSWPNRFPSDKKHVWLENTLEYYRRWIKLHRNRPSVIMWSLCNETYWDWRRPEDMAIAREILDTVKTLDPIHPQEGDGECSWDGLLPTISIHYPEYVAGPVRKQYPNSGLVVPNDLYWLTKDGVNKPWRAEFKWDRPLMIGEYWWVTGEPSSGPFSSYMGDSIFDWEYWRWRDFPMIDIVGLDEHPANLWTETLKKATDAYRVQGVACLNPWSGVRKEIIKPVSVRPLDFHKSFFSGEKGKRKMVVFNDSRPPARYKHMHLQCRLAIDGVTIWREKIDTQVPQGENRIFDISFNAPLVTKPTKATLTARLRYWTRGGFHEINRLEENVYIMPKVNMKDIDKSAILMVDVNGETAKVFKQLNFDVQVVGNLKSADLNGKKLVIIGRHNDASKFDAVLNDFVNLGGKILILQQKNWQPFAAELPESDPKHVSSQSWFRSFNHPILEGLTEDQIQFWRPDNIVGSENYWKPANGLFSVILDCGGRYGMRWSPLLTVNLGKGEYILSQLNIIDRVKVEPAAGLILKNMIEYALAGKNTQRKELRVLAGSNDSLTETLKACSVVTKDGLDGDGPILIDGSAELTSDDLKKVKDYLESGGFVWLHDFTPETIDKLKDILPETLKLIKPDETVQSAARRTHDKLLNNLANFDFYWTRVNIGARKDYFQAGISTAKLGDFVMKTSQLETEKPLLAPAFWTKLKVGAGTVLFDTLRWERALGAESDKVARIVSSIVKNAGGDIKLIPEKQYDYFNVDLAKFANMGYYDKIEGDKKGGWTDQGLNDMRFFLINHTGKDSGTADGNDVGVEDFPVTSMLARRPFKLIDPKVNAGKSVITFRGGKRCDFLTESVKGIPVDKKCDKLWFLQTGAYVKLGKQTNRKMAEYMVHYEDGSSVAVPVRIALEIGDWCNPTPLPNAEVAWTGANLQRSPVGIWAMSWKNPFPNKKIKSIDVNANLEPSQLILLGITGGVEKKKSRVISSWDFRNFKDGSIKNEVPGMPELKSRKLAQESVGNDNNEAGLKFINGRALYCKSKDIPGFFDGSPLGVIVTLILQGDPDGRNAGVFQCMHYMRSGFRMMIEKNGMKLRCEIFTGPDKVSFLKSKTNLVKGRKYKINLKFENGKAFLFINDKLDACIETSPPAPCEEPIVIGVASGKDYNFNGIIESVSIE